MAFPDDNQADPFKQGRSATNDLLGGFSSRADLLETQSQALQTDAMELMQRALTNAPQVTAQQGIAAALLAAIPTLGGALIGRAVGSTKIPQGVYGVRGLDSMGGQSAGGAMGAEIGGKASQDFLTRLDRTKETTPILMAQANLKNQQGNQLAQQANQVENARLQGQLNIDMMPLEEQRQMRLQNNSAANSLKNQRELQGDINRLNELSPEANLMAAQALGLPTDRTYSTREITAIRQAKETARLAQGQQFRQEETKGAEVIDGAEILPGSNPNPTGTAKAQAAMANYNIMVRQVIPELKRSFTDPNAALEQKNTAIANAIIAIKNQQGMGANFTVMENELVKAGLPRIATLDLGDAIAATKASLQGQDILGKISRLEEISRIAVDAQINPYGYKLNSGAGAVDPGLAAIDAQIQALSAQLGVTP